MNLSDFDYILPKELIAKEPTQNREKSRLLIVNDHKYHNFLFENVINFLDKDDLLVLNNTKVIKARLFGNKITGGKIEILIERILSNHSFTAHIKSNKTIPIGLKIIFPNNLIAFVTEKLDGLFKLQTNDDIDLYKYLEQYGHIPLPPYINRSDNNIDIMRYQTIFAHHLGSVAAPTASLHFTPELIEKIKLKGIKIAYLTLHVGSGTFKPVTSANILNHKMHSEIYNVPQKTIDLIKETKKNNGKIIAGGTTTLRTLETIAKKSSLKEEFGETDIFITPGFKFLLVDKLITNFHLPKSTLLMLVSAFAGIDVIKDAYKYAIKEQYRFFSYGDSMLLSRKE